MFCDYNDISKVYSNNVYVYKRSGNDREKKWKKEIRQLWESGKLKSKYGFLRVKRRDCRKNGRSEFVVRFRNGEMVGLNIGDWIVLEKSGCVYFGRLEDVRYVRNGVSLKVLCFVGDKYLLEYDEPRWVRFIKFGASKTRFLGFFPEKHKDLFFIDLGSALENYVKFKYYFEEKFKKVHRFLRWLMARRGLRMSLVANVDRKFDRWYNIIVGVILYFISKKEFKLPSDFLRYAIKRLVEMDYVPYDFSKSEFDTFVYKDFSHLTRSKRMQNIYKVFHWLSGYYLVLLNACFSSCNDSRKWQYDRYIKFVCEKKQIYECYLKYVA